MEDRWRPRVDRAPTLSVPVPLDPTGCRGPTKGQAEGPFWRRTSPGLYVPHLVTEECLEQRILEAWCSAGDEAVVTGWAALRLHGAAFFDGLASDGRGRRPVPVIPGRGRIRAQAGREVLRFALRRDDVTVRHGITCTRPEVALFDEIRRVGDLREAVVAIDMALAGRVTSVSRIRAHLRHQVGQRHRRLALRALDLADDNVLSPQETRLRLVWTLDAGWAKPLTNCRVFDLSGRLLGVPDLLDPRFGVAGEYDGADHRDRARHQRDVRRLADFTAAGLEVVTAVGGDLHAPEVIRARMEQARQRAAARVKRWTLNPWHAE